MRNKRCNIKLLEAELKYLPPNVEESIKEIDELLEDEKHGIQRYPRKNMDIIELEKRGIPVHLRDLFDAQYSADKVVMPYEDIVSMIIEYTVQNEFTQSGYINVLRQISQAILLEMEKEKLQVLVDKLDKDEYNDILIDYLLNAYGIKREFKSDKYLRENPYIIAGKICEVAQSDKNKAKDMLNEYITKEYLKGHADLGWPKAAETWEPYNGLWSYEAAAIAKLFKIDDSELKDNPNYPYDLAHYKSGVVAQGNIEPVTPVVEEEVEEEYIAGIPLAPEFEQFIAPKFHAKVNELIADFGQLSDEEFYDKYELGEIYFDLDHYLKEKTEGKFWER
ncbi:PoNe immunity protein domain-containing protein [Butyrivibrio sp. VCB2001]|uniref:PoNe immunity protein domain-containing protein n=1 Tax=Butyrivibrio sp. VCB2001 TaxID=1280667 RepID=UPI00040A07A1|nr:PoNe immunity protein domain-containing protein [Butyrivibrio sp. VCB2001]